MRRVPLVVGRRPRQPLQHLVLLLRDLAAAERRDGAVRVGQLAVHLLQVVLPVHVRLGQVVVHLQHLVADLQKINEDNIVK